MELSEITQKHIDGILESTPIQKMLGFSSCAILFFTIKLHGDNFLTEFSKLTLSQILAGNNPAIGQIDLSIIFYAFCTILISSIIYKYVRIEIFSVLSKFEVYKSRIAGLEKIITSVNSPDLNFSDLRSTLNEKRKQLLSKNWQSEFVFYLFTSSLISSFYNVKMLGVSVLFILIVLAMEFSHFMAFINECLPCIVILKVKFHAKDTNYPF